MPDTTDTLYSEKPSYKPSWLNVRAGNWRDVLYVKMDCNVLDKRLMSVYRNAEPLCRLWWKGVILKSAQRSLYDANSHFYSQCVAPLTASAGSRIATQVGFQPSKISLGASLRSNSITYRR